MVPYTSTDTRLQGFMPFNRQFGFVFTRAVGNDAMALARTAAHELAHGTFNLRHTFSTENKFVLPEGSTDNLMDYPSAGSGLTTATEATRLNKYQWDLIHNPQKVWFSWLEEEKEGALIAGYYKFKIIETKNELSPNSEFKAMRSNEKVSFQLFRNDTIIKVNWKLGGTSINDTSTFVLDKSKEIKDTLKVFDKDARLLASIVIDIYDISYTFKIVELNKMIQAKTEFPVMRRRGNYHIQLFKGDSLIRGNWTYGTLKTNDTTVFSIDLYNTKKDSVKVYDKSSKQLAAFVLNIYNKPDIKLENKDTYDGSFGFDNFYNNHAALATDANYRSHYLLGTKKWIPWLSVYKKQPNIQLQLKINNDSEFLRDSMAYIKINVSNANIKTSIPTIPGNAIKFSDIASITNTLDLEIAVSDHLDDNQYLYFTDNANDTLAMMSVLCKEPSRDKILHIYELSDSTTNHAFSIDTTQFDTKSYNQAFVDWTIEVNQYMIPQKDYFSKRVSALDNNSRRKIIGMLNYYLYLKYGIDISGTRGIPANDFYLILVPVDSITQSGDGSTILFTGFCLEQTLSPLVFTHTTMLSIAGDKTKIAIHEVGHSFQLRHTFEAPYNIPQGKTGNYMDYSYPNMFYFWKEQWKIINPNKFNGL